MGGKKLLNYGSILKVVPTQCADGKKRVKDDYKGFSMSNQNTVQ